MYPQILDGTRKKISISSSKIRVYLFVTSICLHSLTANTIQTFEVKSYTNEKKSEVGT